MPRWSGGLLGHAHSGEDAFVGVMLETSSFASLLLRQGPTAVAGLPEEDAAALEERTLKMRKAMGENLADDVAGESVDARTRRINMIRWGAAVSVATHGP